MQTKQLQKKISRQRLVRAEVLRYIRQNTEIIEDLYANHTQYFKVKNLNKDYYVFVDWKKVIFIQKKDFIDKMEGDMLPRVFLLASQKAIMLDRWF